LRSAAKAFLNFLINSNVYISFAALCYTLQTQVQLGLNAELHPYLFLIFFATLFEYNSHRFIAIINNRNILKLEKNSWVNEHLKLFYFIVFISVAGFIVASVFAMREVLFALLPIGLLTLFYSFPLYKIGQRLFRFREIPGAKIFIISLVWSLTTIILPVIQKKISVDNLHVFFDDH